MGLLSTLRGRPQQEGGPRAATGEQSVVAPPDFAPGYLEFTATQMATGIEQLHAANNWAVSIALASVIAVFLSPTYPDTRSAIILCGSFSLSCHFLVRAMKGYINVLRWSLLEQSASELVLSSAELKETILQTLRAQNQTYFLQWRSPIQRWMV
jgi:hypothetical protein